MIILMKMNILIIYLIVFLKIKNIEGRSEEFNECVELDKTVYSVSDCTNIKIPDSEGYNCCAMKITFNQDSTYSCLALEKKYTTNQDVLNEYMSKKNISFLFASVGGKIEIDCGNKLKISENYKKFSDEYLNCYNNHIKGIDNENNCTKNDIPASEGSKCCFVETSTKSDNGNIINDKRCYIIQDEYFTHNKNLINYLLDESNNNLDEYNKTNITISCKNYDTFFYSGFDNNLISIGNSDIIEKTESFDTSVDTIIKIPSSSSKSGLKAWKIILVILGSIIFIGIIIFIALFCLRKKKKESEKKNEISGIEGFQSNSSNNK